MVLFTGYRLTAENYVNITDKLGNPSASLLGKIAFIA